MHNQIHAQLWTLSNGKAPTTESLGPGAIGGKIPAIKAAIENATPRCPSFFIFSARGDLARGNRGTITESGNLRIQTHLLAELAPLEEFLGLNSHVHGLFDTLRPYQNYFTDYDDSLEHRKSITFLLRIGPNRQVINLALRVHLPSSSAVALLIANDPNDLAILRSHTTAYINSGLLGTSPLGILPLILEQRSRSWDQWAHRLWQVINEIESSKELAPEEWVTCTPSEERKRELNDADILQKRLSKVRVEIAHGKGIVEGGLRLGKFCREAIAVVYGEEHLQGALMGGGLRPGERELLVERIRGSMSTCEALVERLTELEARHNGHLGHINNIIAQVETKTNRAVAEITLDVARVAASDSRTMKTIGFVEMIFLPAIFISTVWGAGGVVDIDGATTNKYVFVGAILTLTVIVLSSWGFYMWYYREPLGQGHSAVLRAGLDIV